MSPITHTPLVDYAVPGPGDYYQLPFARQKTVVIEPYAYDIDGKQVLLTSISKPVGVNGKALDVRLRLPPELHARAAMVAEAQHKSLNAWVQDVIEKGVATV